MIVTVERFGHGLDSTLSRITVPFEPPAWVLEDEWRATKVKHETRIPAGKYKVKLRTVGGFHERYTKKFPDIHIGMLWLQDVPNFQYILLHVGNTDEDTDGCLLVGEVPIILPDGEFQVSRSVDAYRRLYPPMARAARSGYLSFEVYSREDG